MEKKLHDSNSLFLFKASNSSVLNTTKFKINDVKSRLLRKNANISILSHTVTLYYSSSYGDLTSPRKSISCLSGLANNVWDVICFFGT